MFYVNTTALAQHYIIEIELTIVEAVQNTFTHDEIIFSKCDCLLFAGLCLQ